MKKIIFGTIFIILSIIIHSYSYAQTESELRSQINNTNNQIAQLDEEIRVLSGQIAKTGEEKKTLANAIKDLNLRKDKLIKERQQTEKKISATTFVINTLNSEINTKDSLLNNSKESLSSLLKNLNQQDGNTFIQKLLVESSLSDFSEEYNNVITLNNKIKENIQKLSIQKNDLTISKTKKEVEQKTLTTLKNNLLIKEKEIAVNKKEKDTLLVETNNKESNYKKLLLEQQKRKDAFEKSLEDYESQLQFILNPKSIPKEGSGVLSWPLKSITITSPYGSRWGKFHYGLDLRAAIGTPVKSMAGGVVLGTGDTDIACKGASFGKWVFIKYNNGLSSTFGHLSSISAHVGDKVSTGEIVGYSGNTGSSTGPHLHIAVYASEGVNVATVPSKSCGGKIFTQPIAALTAYLNPSLYLPK